MKTKFTVESLAKQIEADNEIFNNATDAEKRVIVAEDCLIRMELEQIKAKSGHFCNFKDIERGANVKQALATTTTIVCNACAKDSLFMSYIGRVNHYNRGSQQIGNEEHNIEHTKLLEIFDAEQLSLIEFAFEGKQYIFKENGLSAYFDDIVAFREKVALDNELILERDGLDMLYDHSVDVFDKNNGWSFESERVFEKALMVAICNNIIENKGEFIL